MGSTIRWLVGLPPLNYRKDGKSLHRGEMLGQTHFRAVGHGLARPKEIDSAFAN